MRHALNNSANPPEFSMSGFARKSDVNSIPKPDIRVTQFESINLVWLSGLARETYSLFVCDDYCFVFREIPSENISGYGSSLRRYRVNASY